MNIWKRIFGTLGQDLGPRLRATSPEPVAPFESWVEDEFDGSRKIFRPLLYMFQHRELPRCLFQGHPAIAGVLEGGSNSTSGLSHILTRAALSCEGNYGWPDDLETDEAYPAYASAFLDRMNVQRHDGRATALCTIEMPPPIAPLEVCFVALWVDSSRGSEIRRYFTPEKAGDTGCCLCEWTADGSHKNFGDVPVMDRNQFAASIADIASSPYG